ncbi:DUF1846 family protein [Candidatus Woesearchaeota archaeon]|nr:DUF1846 family protein [Candidatus Woesearchaeota archaeon]
MMQKGFDTELYLAQQTKRIIERVNRFEKLYLEFGGKLLYDYHASRVLPGYKATTKIDLLKKLGEIEIIYCVGAKDINKGRIRGDFGLTYDNQTLKDIADLKELGLEVSAVVITRYQGEHSADKFKRRLENHGIRAYFHTEIEGYPHDMDKVIKGYESQEYVHTRQKLIIVTGAGGGSGKMAFCMSQIYNERRHGIKTGFSKFESFPIWNLPLDHPINVAYEAATADLLDVNMIDPFHKEAYGIDSVNYNRDIENFDILKSIMGRITGAKDAFGFKSPTDMGVNALKEGITDEEVCKEAARQEIIRRYFRYHREKVDGIQSQDTLDQMEKIMAKVNVKPEDRLVVIAAREAQQEAKQSGKGYKDVYCGAAVQLEDGTIVKGKNSSLLHAESAAIINAVKHMAKIPDKIDLLSPEIIKTISHMKNHLLNKKSSSLNVDETLVALAISSTTNPTAKEALMRLKELRGCEMHVTHMPKHGDEAGLMRLSMNITTDAKLSTLSGFD